MGLFGNNAKMHLNKGWECTQKGDLANALKEYQEAIRLDPGNASYHNVIASCHIMMKNYDSARVEFLEAIRLSPQDPKMYADLGMYYNIVKLYDEAITACNRSLQIANNGRAHNNLSAAYRNKGLIEDAIRESGEAIRLEPNMALYHSTLAEALDAKGLSREALTEMKTASGMDPANKFYLNMLNKYTSRLSVPPAAPPQGSVQVKEIIREVVKVPCEYCGALVDMTSAKCPACGASFNPRQ